MFLVDMLNILLLLVIVMFIFAVVGVTLFGSTVAVRFGDLGSGMR
jgi:ABC-type polysaccharide/polyol phosphate export permease